MSKKGFTAFDLSEAINSPSEPPAPAKRSAPAKKTKKSPETRSEPQAHSLARVQRAIYFPKDLDEDLRRWAYEDNRKITQIVIEAVRAYGKKRQ